jgi:undecaprenyl-diphosphatase
MLVLYRRWEGRLRVGLLVGVLALPVVFVLDLWIHAELVALGTHGVKVAMQAITHLGGGAAEIGSLILLGLIGWWRGDRGLRTRGLIGGAGVAAAGLVEQVIKNLTCRARPSAPEAGAFFTDFPCFPAKYAYASFPSGHATTAFAAAVFLTLWYPRGAPIFLALALLMGLSRVFLGSHFPADVWAGALIGTATALGIHAYVPAARRRPQESAG